MADDGDVSLPKATINKMVKDFLPGDMRVANDTVDMLMQCCTEFIHMLSTEANNVATSESRSMIQPEHVVKALEELGLGDFTVEVMKTWDSFKEDSKSAQKLNLRKTMADQAGLSEEQQIALQQQMFAAARARSLQSNTLQSVGSLQTAQHPAQPSMDPSAPFLGPAPTPQQP